MATKTFQVVKLPPRRKILPCGARDCDISTNKRYRPPVGGGIVACMFSHAEAVYRRRNGKAAVAA
jgi:hypothetical protein